MPDIPRDIADDGAEHDDEEVIEQVAADVLDDIEHGQVDGDTSTVLEDRLEQRGIHLRGEAIESIADDIETDASR